MSFVGDYYIGLDCGTESVGFAVADTDYNIVRAKGRSFWGVRLFNEAATAAERRNFRSARRRYMRKKERIKILQALFADEINKVDPEFFIRLNDSAYLKEDKHIDQKNSLFNDIGYTDKEYYKDYPTIYHLRKALIEGYAPSDIRLLYLALHHILKHRGHFLFEGKEFSSIMDLSGIISDIKDSYSTVFESDLDILSKDGFESAILSKGNRDKQEKLGNVIICDKTKKSLIIKCIIGNTVKADKLFDNDEYADLPAIRFSSASFEENDLPELEDNLDDDEFRLLSLLKAVYDWSLLVSVMKGYEYLSEAKVAAFEKNKNDLALLKKAVKFHAPEEYEAFFHGYGKKNEDSFSHYIGVLHSNGRKVSLRRCSTEDFYKRVKRIIGDKPEDKESRIILEEIADGNFLVLLSSFRNGVVPYQVHKKEMDVILSNYADAFPFLLEKDEEGLSVVDKLHSLIEYRIPYYVGPLGRNEKNISGWMARKKDGKILPWNFHDIVDEDGSAEKFIQSMTSKCTYLPCEDVIPRYSILYSSFMVLNDLNNLRINGVKLSTEQKQMIFRDLFLAGSKVTQSKLRKYMLSNGWYSKNDKIELSGIDGDFKNTMQSYRDFKPYFEAGKLSHKDAEDIIRWLTIFSDGGTIAGRKIKEAFGNVLSDDDISRITRSKYTGWGRLSSKFLNGIRGINRETGKEETIIEAMWNTQHNLMELLSSDYEYIGQTGDNSSIDKLDYSVVDDLYVSPSVKRQIWQTLKIVDEIVKVMGKPPRSIFVETTRNKQANPQRTISRKARLLAAFDQFKDSPEVRELIDSLESTDDSLIARRDKLFLYYTQMGKCMYTGKPINLEEIGNTSEYDIDHIYPYSKSDDDSLDNRVLVYQAYNREKSADYPLKDDIRTHMAPFWKHLLDLGLISEKKYARLVRNTPLDAEDEKGFINRQLVETSQTTKATIDILRRYFGDAVAIVFSKASKVSEFRTKYEFWKSRSINSLHHAKDAYLNIVVGNVLRTKYSSEYFRGLVSDTTGYYNISKPFEKDVKGAWIAGDDGTISTVRKYMSRNDILFTRQQIIQSGGLFDQMAVSKGNGQLPRKMSDPVLRKKLSATDDQNRVLQEWIDKYGGYNKPTISHFAIIKFTDRKKRIISFIPVPKLYANELSSADNLVRYCERTLGYKDVEIIRARVLINTMISVNGFRCTISGSSSGGQKFVVSSAVSLLLDNSDVRSIKRIEKFIERRQKGNNAPPDLEHDGISREINEHLYSKLLEKSLAPIYSSRPANQSQLLSDSFEAFREFTVEDQCRLIIEILNYFAMNSGAADFSSIKGGKKAGILNYSSRINDKTKLVIYDQSVTGIYEKALEIK